MQHLLFLAHRIPYLPTKGDKVRSYNLLLHLSRIYRLHLGAFVDDEADLAHVDALTHLCETCHLVTINPRLAKLKCIAGLLSPEPLTLAYYRSLEMQQWVDEVLRLSPIRKVLVFSAAMAQYVMSAEGVLRVADLVDVDSDKWRQYALAQRWPYSALYKRESRTLLNYEREIARAFDATSFVSEAEADLFRKLAPEVARNVWHVNNGVDAEYFSPEREYLNPYGQSRRVVVFTGAMDYWPNVDAVVWFAREVFPAVRERLPDALFCIVGARPTSEVTRLGECAGVRVTGTVPDIRPYLAHASLAVAPLRTARGIQNKILEAMAMGKAVLASPQAAEGIEAQIGTDLLVASGPEEFARRTSELLEHSGDCPVGAAGRARVLRSYDWKQNLKLFEKLLTSAAHGDDSPGVIHNSALCDHLQQRVL